MEIQGKIADKMTFFTNFSANLVISVVKLVDAECRYHENEEPAVIAPLLDCYFFSEVLAVKEFSRPFKFSQE